MAQYQGVLNASNFILMVGESLGTATPVGFATDLSISISEDPRDTTNKFSEGWRTLAEGLRSFSISASHLFAENATNGEAELWSALENRNALFFKCTVQNGSITSTDEVDGNTRFTGQIRITSLERSGGVEDNVTFSLTGEGTGPLVREIISE